MFYKDKTSHSTLSRQILHLDFPALSAYPLLICAPWPPCATAGNIILLCERMSVCLQHVCFNYSRIERDLGWTLTTANSSPAQTHPGMLFMFSTSPHLCLYLSLHLFQTLYSFLLLSLASSSFLLF